MSKHVSGGPCPSCELKLSMAHPEIVVWYRGKKESRPNMHISCSYRNKEDQEQAFAEGKSHLRYPKSAHNYALNGKPLSKALDLFEQIDGVARFSPGFYAKLASDSKDAGDPILWGGTFKSLGDSDHFEWREPS